jgi:predicted acylesterase/phospholipase RssA
VLSSWGSFYVIVGTSGGALIGHLVTSGAGGETDAD